MAGFDSLGSQSANQASEEFDRVGMDCRRRQAVAEDDRKLTRAAGTARQPLRRIRIERTSEVGPPEIILPVAYTAGDIECVETKIAKA